MPDTARVASLLDSYVHALFQRLKETHFEQMLLMVLARNLDLAQVMLSDQLPKGQRTFSENDVREFLERFNKQEMHIHFLVAKNARPPQRGSTQYRGERLPQRSAGIQGRLCPARGRHSNPGLF